MKFLLLLSFFICSQVLHSQTNATSITEILDNTISKAKEISYYTNGVNWDALSADIKLIAKDAQSIDDLKPAFECLLNGLRDHHGQIRKTSDYSMLASFTDQKNARKKDERDFDSDVWAIVNNVDARFEYAILPNNIGYLKIVGVGPNLDGQMEAERIRGAVQEMCSSKVNHWIIDLRYNGGGNINVMLAGIAPLFDQEKIVVIQDANGKIQTTAEIKNGDFWYYGAKAFEMDNKPNIRNSKIAILTSRWTWSSGEVVAVAFKGQKNTKFFGEKTGGYTTNNSWDVIGDEIALVISTGVYCDRNGNEYLKYVEPDVEIVFEVKTEKEKDRGIIEATKWLNSNN